MECRRYSRRLGVLVLVAAQLRLFVSAQDCLQAAGGRATPFRDDNGSPYLPSGTQAIITSYKFECCGNITAWQTYVQPGGGAHKGVYDITFQVWRPSPSVRKNGCYSLVGENRFRSLSLGGGGGLVSETPKPTNTLTVQPGDVVGYFTLSRNGFEYGIQLDTSGIDNVWYNVIVPSKPVNPRSSNCPLPVGTEADRILNSSTNAPPILSVGISSYSCLTTRIIIPPTHSSRLPSPSSSRPLSMSATTTSTGSSTHTQLSSNITQPPLTPTIIPGHTSITSPVLSVSISTSPTPSTPGDNPTLNTAVIASLTVVGGSALLLTLLCILVLAITLAAKAKQRRQRTLAEPRYIMSEQQANTFSMRMQENEAYSSTTHGIDASTINTESNLAYKAIEMNRNQVTTPALRGIEEFSPTESHLYESVAIIRSELCSPDDEHFYLQVL